jgi:HEAT repeat protein
MSPTLEQLARLRHTEANERSAAVLALKSSRTVDDLPLLLDLLRTEQDLNVREDISYIIGTLGHAATPALVVCLTDADAAMRHHAAHILGKIADPAVAEALLGALADTDAAVVHKALLALDKIRATLDVPRVLPALIALLVHPNATVQSTLNDLFERIGAPAVPALIAAAQTADQAPMRARAVEVLALVGDMRALPPLIAALGDAVLLVRLSAIDALLMLPVRGEAWQTRQTALAHATSNEADPHARQKLTAAVNQLSKRGP